VIKLDRELPPAPPPRDAVLLELARDLPVTEKRLLLRKLTHIELVRVYRPLIIGALGLILLFIARLLGAA
jgi:hypothetical protein